MKWIMVQSTKNICCIKNGRYLCNGRLAGKQSLKNKITENDQICLGEYICQKCIEKVTCL